MAITDLDQVGLELMRSVESDELSIDGTTMEIVGTSYYTGVTGTGDTVPHLFKFWAVDMEDQGYDGEVLWDMSDNDDLVEEAMISESGSLRYENIDSLDVVDRVDHTRRQEEERLTELYEDAKDEYEERNQSG
jgi:hypothetical protein